MIWIWIWRIIFIFVLYSPTRVRIVFVLTLNTNTIQYDIIWIYSNIFRHSTLGNEDPPNRAEQCSGYPNTCYSELSLNILKLNVLGNENFADKKFHVNITEFWCRQWRRRCLAGGRFCAWGSCPRHMYHFNRTAGELCCSELCRVTAIVAKPTTFRIQIYLNMLGCVS
jgi:hypothetical protein